MMYPNDTNLRALLNDHLTSVAPGFTLIHYHAEPHHNHVAVTLCSGEGLNRLRFEVKVYGELVLTDRFGYIGTKPCHHHRLGYDPRVTVMIEAYPDAHIQHVDNEQDGDDAVFGYLAYDDAFNAVAWAPIPLDDEGTPMPDAPVVIHTIIPINVFAETEYIRHDVARHR